MSNIVLSCLLLNMWCQVLAWTSENKFSKHTIATWTPTETDINLGSVITCAAWCHVTPGCRVFDYVGPNCNLGSPPDFAEVPGGMEAFVNLEEFKISVTISVVELLNNNAIPDTTVTITNLDTNEVTSGTSDAGGSVTLQVIMLANVVVEVSKIGYYTVTNEITLTNAANQPFTMATTMTLPPNVYRGVMLWQGVVNDLDLHAREVTNTPGSDCTHIYYYTESCNFNNLGAKISLETDAVNFGNDGGEAMTWEGIFPSNFKSIIYVNRFSDTDKQLSSARTSFTIFGTAQPIIINSPETTIPTNQGQWVVGCFEPTSATFTEINQYTTDWSSLPCP